MTQLSPTALEEAAKAIEAAELAWKAANGGDKASCIDCPDEVKATAAITAYLAQAGKEGWVLVPKVASEAMLKAGARKARLNDSKMQDAPGYEGECHDIYAAMLAAAQNGVE